MTKTRVNDPGFSMTKGTANQRCLLSHMLKDEILEHILQTVHIIATFVRLRKSFC